MEGESFRKASIGSKLSKLITDNQNYSVANILRTVLRTKNIRTAAKDSYEMNDEDLLVAVEETVKGFKHIKDNERY